MAIYWALFLLPAIATLSPLRAAADLNRLCWLGVWSLFGVLIGLRYEVGGDWWTYLHHYDLTVGVPFKVAVFTSDFAYAGLNWLAAQFDLQIYAVNCISAGIFLYGLILFCRRQPFPWLAFSISVPYVVTVIGMGYTRQSIALGFVFWAYEELRKQNQLRFIILVVTAALFHKTAIIVLPLGVLAASKHGKFKVMALVSMAGLIVLAALADRYELLWHNYIEAGLNRSEGGAIRIWMNVIPGILLLMSWKYWRRRWTDTTLWVWVSFLALACVPFVGSYSTTVDRLAFYLIPLQVVVFSRLPALISDMPTRTFVTVLILGYYGLVLGVWLNFSSYSWLWIPYKTVLLSG